MQIKVNGEFREIEEGATLYALISALKLEERVMAAALNMQIVKQEKWKEARLQEG
ncbi:MAG: sulfur carrier protein ThiS, partial [Sulfuricurvum sp.]